MFGLVPFNSSGIRNRRTGEGLNISLAQDAMSLLHEAVTAPFDNSDVTSIRNTITQRISEVL